VVTGRQTENQNAGRGQARDGTEDWRVRGTVMNGCWPGLCFALPLRYSILLCISPGSRYCQRAVVVRIAATRGQQEMKRLSASRRGDPGRALPLGGRTPVASLLGDAREVVRDKKDAEQQRRCRECDD
jgi:hypothetical protein